MCTTLILVDLLVFCSVVIDVYVKFYKNFERWRHKDGTQLDQTEILREFGPRTSKTPAQSWCLISPCNTELQLLDDNSQV